MTLSSLMFVVLVVGVGAFAWWIYSRREVAISGRKTLGITRALILVFVLVLIWDPRLPDATRAFTSGDRWVLIDGSTSMGVGPSGEQGTWSLILDRARELADGGARILVFGEIPFEALSDSLESLTPDEARTRLAPALARVIESGATDVTLLSDLRLDDPIEVKQMVGRSSLQVQIERSEPEIKNVGVAHFELPVRAEEGESLVADIAVFAEGTEPSDTVRIEIREEDRLITSTHVIPAELGRLAVTSLQLPSSQGKGWTRYGVSVTLEGDQFAEDDTKVTLVEVDPEEQGVVLLSLQPDWEPRFLLPVLSQVTGLDAVGYLSMSEGRYLRMGSGGEADPPIDEAIVRRSVSQAELLVVHGVGVELPEWVRSAMASVPRAIVFPADEIGAAAGGVNTGRALSGEWYASPDLPPSPLAASLSGAVLTGLPPLAAVLPQDQVQPSLSPLHVQLQGSGPAEAALVLHEAEGRRRTVILASGFWRWAFRGGSEREVYRRLWAGIVGWLFSLAPEGEGMIVRPIKRVWSAGEPMAWSAPGMIGEEIDLLITVNDSVAMDTVVVVDQRSVARTRGLPAASYTYTVAREGTTNLLGSGRVESERHSLELYRRPSQVPEGGADREGAAAVVGGAGQPLRTHPAPYLLILVLLTGEWIGRRWRGLR
ncbi:MAG: hypothetical protein VYD78_06840 [Gemmatimonadota bacterium]|nr:hypothetical protein [Gemmatimonadota bacterium]